jgi:hypothetical protein
MSGWQIPEPLDYDWPMRDTSSAQITVRELDDGRLEQTIEHAPLLGVTPEMLLWMIENMGDEVEWRGQRCILYRCWHPTDHIYFKVLGEFEPGCRFHVVEAFQARTEYLQDRVFHVPKLDRTGFRLGLRRFGQVVMSMDEEWQERPEGLAYRVHQLVGSTAPIMGPLSRLIRRRKMAFLTAWHLHNVQEVGNLPHVLPGLYACYASQPVDASP